VTIEAPELLAGHHLLADFSSGVASLDDWLKRRALANQVSGASRTYVACEAMRVVGYYALASSGVTPAAAPGRFRRNMPDPIPVVVLGRLAIDHRHRRRGLDRALFHDAARRVVRAADLIGVRGIIVHAISEEAKAFYTAIGFDPSPLDPMTLLVTLADLRAAMDETPR
jgi:GNAT superfamily N-acetyltransferase